MNLHSNTNSMWVAPGIIVNEPRLPVLCNGGVTPWVNTLLTICAALSTKMHLSHSCYDSETACVDRSIK